VKLVRLRTHFFLLFSLGLTLAVGGCGGISGEPSSGWTTFDEPEGAYRIYFLVPPWEFVDHEDGVTRLRIAPNGRVVDGGPQADNKYDLVVRESARDAFDMATRAVSQAREEDREVLEAPREIETEDGLIGWEIVTRSAVVPIRYQRRVWVNQSGSGSWAIDIESTPDPRHRELDHLIRLFEVDPDTEEGTP